MVREYAMFVMLTILLIVVTPVFAASFNAKDLGAVGDGRTNDWPAIQSAINKAIQAGPGNSVEIPSGSYLLGASGSDVGGKPLLIRNASNFALVGAPDTKLIATSPYNDVLQVINSNGVKIQSLQFDRSELLFVQGNVEAIDASDKSVVVDVDSAFDDLDGHNMFPARAPKTLLLVYVEPDALTFDHSATCAYYNSRDQTACWPPKITAHVKLADHRWKLSLDGQPQADYVGKPFVLWSAGAYTSRVLFISSSSNVDIESLTYFGEGAGNAVTINHSSGNIVFNHLTIATPANSKLRFAGGGGFMVFNNHIHLLINNSTISNVWDDAFNMGANFSRIYRQTSPSTIEVDGSRETFKVGDTLAVYDWATKSQRERAAIKSVTCMQAPPPATCRLELDKGISEARVGVAPVVSLGNDKDGIDRIIDLSDVGTLDIRGSNFHSIHAHGILVKASNSSIIDNVIHDTPMGGILVGPQFTWDEGPGVDNLQISQNTFLNDSGTNIRVESSFSTQSRDNRNIVISNNKFIDYGRYSHGVEGVIGVPIVIRNVAGGRVESNSFNSKYYPSTQPILLENSDAVTTEGAVAHSGGP